MNRLDRWPSTPIKQITAWAFTIVWFIFSCVIVWMNHAINEPVYYALTAAVWGVDLNTVIQYKAKRDSAWPTGAPTASEIGKSAEMGQPARPSGAVSAPRS